MDHNIFPPDSLLDTLPDPERIRDRLYVLLKEARLLRRLLRVAVDIHREWKPESDRSKTHHAG
jgi:hypothetical protein